ncbi:hypothetical protein [Pseudomonas sp.]|uniref:hypothetical protein n=1 Tax=Pseudomonas sp. TaxID=306 RepID=UPI003BB75E7B
MSSSPNKAIFLAALFVITLAPTASWAFKISPCLRVLTYAPGVLGQLPINGYNQCHLVPSKTGLAVHEHLTRFAIYQYRQVPVEKKLNYRKEPMSNWSVGGSRPHITSDLIYGSWWNDDPLMLLWGEWTDLFNGALTFGKFFSTPQQETYPGGSPACKSIARNNSLTWNSHYGRLQHLHFMSDGEKTADAPSSLLDVREKALQWIEFAYGVATLETPYDTPLTPATEARLGLPSIGDNYCLSDNKHTTIRTLFARVGMDDARRTKMVPDVALGSIFHVLQDSFSPAHTCRIEEKVNGQSYAVLTKTYNYADQVAKPNGELHHGELDVYPGWLLDFSRTGNHQYANDPVNVAAWLLKAVDARTPWPEVKEHLLDTIFKASDVPAPASPCIGI